MAIESCEKCRFYTSGRHYRFSNFDGECHRYPPKLTEISNSPFVFPQVYRMDWCGEYDERIDEGEWQLKGDL